MIFLSIPRLRCSFTKIPLEGLQRPQISCCTVVTCINCRYKHTPLNTQKGNLSLKKKNVPFLRKPWWPRRRPVFIVYALVMTKAAWRVYMTTDNAVHVWTTQPAKLHQVLARGGDWFQNFMHDNKLLPMSEENPVCCMADWCSPQHLAKERIASLSWYVLKKDSSRYRARLSLGYSP